MSLPPLISQLKYKKWRRKKKRNFFRWLESQTRKKCQAWSRSCRQHPVSWIHTFSLHICLVQRLKWVPSDTEVTGCFPGVVSEVGPFYINDDAITQQTPSSRNTSFRYLEYYSLIYQLFRSVIFCTDILLLKHGPVIFQLFLIPLPLLFWHTPKIPLKHEISTEQCILRHFAESSHVVYHRALSFISSCGPLFS